MEEIMNFIKLKAIVTSNLEEQYSKFSLDDSRELTFKIDKHIKQILKIYNEKPNIDLEDIISNVLNENEYEIYRNYFGIKNNLSPLRYPGAKSKVLKKFVKYFKINHTEYREPFVGGGSIFLGKHSVNNNILNDKDFNVYTFLTVVRDKPHLLCEIIRNTYPTVEMWLEKRHTRTNTLSDIEVAFNFLFFNRTNYSGIYLANPLGGLAQNSKYKIDCRWNSEKLCEKIFNMSFKLKNSKITNLDFTEIINLPGKNVLMVIDPPYYKKGNSLYQSKMSHDDHLRLSEVLKTTQHKYLLTIDDCEETREIYLNKTTFLNQESWKYTIHSKKNDNNGKELFISNFPI